MYEAVIGLEVHAHLATRSKLFCSCSTRFGQMANSNVCEVCSAMPGALPVPNREAIRLAALLGIAVNCRINRRSVFARKNYFYPDLPAGYQISQYELPICEKGHIDIIVNGNKRRIGITRIHMENDAGKNIHSSSENLSFVDLNRAGDPLVEIVSEPDLRSPQEAAVYLKNLHSLVTYLGISDGNMEEGSFRCDANISLRPAGSSEFGTRTELKNLNSFRHVRMALEYEIERQADLLAEGKAVLQETRLYDAAKNITSSMRGKEDAQDYRYFPDPDILPVEISEEELRELEENMPELPQSRLKRFMDMTGLPEAEAEMLVINRQMADFFETAAGLSSPKRAASFILGPLARICNEQNLPPRPEEWPIQPQAIAELGNIVDEGLISAKIAVDIFPELFRLGIMPKAYVEEKGLVQISDSSAIEEAVESVLSANRDKVEEYRAGKTKLLTFFMGKVMGATKGKANPAMVNDLLKRKLSG